MKDWSYNCAALTDVPICIFTGASAGSRSSADAELMFAMEELTDPAQQLQKEQAAKHSTPNKGQSWFFHHYI